jgi:hypothetical protein
LEQVVKKSVLIVLVVAANGFLAACVGQGNLSAIAPPAQAKAVVVVQ